MEANRTCRECGEAVPNDTPFGLCHRCLIALGFVSAEAPRQERSAKPNAAHLKFGDYELIEQIGRGGMGVVYKARQISLNRTVALKMVLDSHLASPVVLRRFLIEAEAAAKLEHPNIVPIYEIAEVEGQHFFSMRLIEGESLEQKIALGEYDIPKIKSRFKTGRDKMQERIAALMAAVARAVHYAHERGVLHRDLKPSNILIDKNGQPHLTDFGLAKVTDSEVSVTPKTTVLGTPGYMSPEQALGGECTAAADIYSLGAILYELLTGKPPFEGPTPLETLRRTKEDEPKSPKQANAAIEGDLAIICLKCLEKDPGRRYSSAEGLAKEVERWLRHEPIEAQPVRITGRLWRWCQREPMLAGMTIGLIALITAIAVLTTSLYQREKKNRLLLEQRSARELKALTDRMQRDRERGDKALRISAPEVAIFARRELPIDGSETPLTLAVMTSERAPDRMIVPFAYMLLDLKDKLREQSDVRVLFDLQLYSRVEDTLDAFGTRADLVWTDAAIYVKARRSIHGLEPIVRETYAGGSELHGAIVTRVDSGIEKLSDLKGRSFAFANIESAIGWYLPKAKLATAGVRSGDVHSTNSSAGRVLTLIRTGVCDAGVVQRRDLEKFRQAGGELRELAPLACPGQPWVLSSKLTPKMVSALRQGLLSMRDNTVLGRITEVTGFIPASPADYDELEGEIERAKEFDSYASK